MAHKVVAKIKRDNEVGARKGLLEELFNDFHTHKKEVYWFNFVRGLFFGMGSIVGGTLLVALVLWILSLLVDVPGGVGDFIEYIINTVQQRQHTP